MPRSRRLLLRGVRRVRAALSRASSEILAWIFELQMAQDLPMLVNVALQKIEHVSKADDAARRHGRAGREGAECDQPHVESVRQTRATAAYQFFDHARRFASGVTQAADDHLENFRIAREIGRAS